MPVGGYGARKNKPNVSHDDAFRVVSAGGTAYFCSSAENRVYAIDAAAGKVKWTFFTGAAARMAPVVWRDKLYFGADDGVFYCVDAKDGKVIWKVACAPTDEKMLGQGRFVSLWPIRAGAMIDGGIAYFTAGLFPAEGIYFFAVRASDGTVLWRRQLDTGGMGSPSPQGYMLATGDSIFMTSRVAPTRWSKADGSTIPLNTPIPPAKDAAYRYHNGGSYAQIWNDRNIVYGQAALLAYDPDKIVVDKYNRKLKGDLIFNWFNARQALFKGKHAYFATDYHILAVDQARLAEMAARECKEFEETYKALSVAHFLDLTQQYDQLVKDHGQDHPKAVWMRNNSLRWGRDKWTRWPAESRKVFAKTAKKCQWMTPVAANESMIMAGDVIYAGGEGHLVALDAGSGREMWRAETGSRVRGLAVAGGRLFVSTIDGKVRCFAASAGGSDAAPVTIRPETAGHPLPPETSDAFCEKAAGDIIAKAGITRGYCLILGGGTGRLAREIARRSELSIYVIEPDARKVARARADLARAGLYGGRICVEQGDLKSLPYPPYVFNIVVDEMSLRGGESPAKIEEILRVTKPCGGVAIVDAPSPVETVRMDLARTLSRLNAKAEPAGPLFRITRGRIPDSKDWTHNYATAANTYCSEDPLVKGPFGVLWYGEPGPQKRIERHGAPPLPLVVNGVMFTTGYDIVMAYDIYNGLQYWERMIYGVTRSSLPLGTSNLVADDSGLFVVVDNRECLKLDARTGKTLMKYAVPPGAKDSPGGRFWGWIARDGRLLLGSRSRLDARRRGAETKISEGVFAVDCQNGKPKWTYQGGQIDHDGIAVGGGCVFLVDRELTDEQRKEGLKNTFTDESVEDRRPVDRRGKPVEPDLRKLIALDVKTGRPLWIKPLNMTDITLDDTIVADGRVGVACTYKSGVVVVHGTGSLGHPHREFLKGEFKRRAIYAFAADSGRLLWGGRKNYRKRPIIAGDHIYAEPYAWHLKTGRPRTIANPLSGVDQKLDFHRGYIGCGHLLASGGSLFGACGGIAWYNLDERSGFTPFANMHLGCGLGAVPAGGVFVAPEGRSGCTCATPIWTSIALFPRRRARTWSAGVAGGMSEVRTLPVKHAFINLGAPGFRSDSGSLWIPYPPARGVATGVIGKWLPTYQHTRSMCRLRSSDLLKISGTDRPWLYTSSYQHTKPLKFNLIAKGSPAAKYTVRLHFAESEDARSGERLFTVFLQDKPVLSDFDIVREARGPGKAIVREFRGVVVADDLKIHMSPSGQAANRTPLLCAFEAIRE